MDEEIMNLLKVEPEGNEHRDHLAVLVASGQAKEMIEIELTQDQLQKRNEKDVEKYFKRYEASLSSKTCDSIVEKTCRVNQKRREESHARGRQKLLLQAESKNDAIKISNDIKSSFSLTQALSVAASIIDSLAGLYLKRKVLMSLFQASPNPNNLKMQTQACLPLPQKSVKIKAPGKSK